MRADDAGAVRVNVAEGRAFLRKAETEGRVVSEWGAFCAMGAVVVEDVGGRLGREAVLDLRTCCCTPGISSDGRSSEVVVLGRGGVIPLVADDVGKRRGVVGAVVESPEAPLPCVREGRLC